MIKSLYEVVIIVATNEDKEYYAVKKQNTDDEKLLVKSAIKRSYSEGHYKIESMKLLGDVFIS